jgi:hypothetical protein
MSVLSRPNGTPERVWSLIGGISALGGDLEREEFVALLNPGYTRAGQPVKAASTLASEGPGVATALGLVTRDGTRLSLASGHAPQTVAAFMDDVHDVLCRAETGDLNSVILETYAWLVAESHRRQDLGWLFDVGQKTFADMADAALVGEDEDGRLMNPTKVPAWRRWLRALGLGVPMPDKGVDFPSPGRRLAIEIRREGVAPGTEFAAEDFIRLVARRCPYLDRGRLFSQACQRAGWSGSPRNLSAVLSCGLRDLELEGIVALRLSGDSANALSLAADPAALQPTFNSVVVLAGGDE